MNQVGLVLFDPVILAEKLYLKKIIVIQPVSRLISAHISNSMQPAFQKINLNPSKLS